MQVYRGYWDSKENTDNAWWEIVVFNFHDEAGNGLGAANFKPGTRTVRWRTKFDSQNSFNVVSLVRGRLTLDEAEWLSEAQRRGHRLRQAGREQAQCPLVDERTWTACSRLQPTSHLNAFHYCCLITAACDRARPLLKRCIPRLLSHSIFFSVAHYWNLTTLK